MEFPGGLGGNAAGRGTDIAGRGHDLIDDATVIEVIRGVVPGAGLEGLALLAGDLGFFSGDTNFHEELSEGWKDMATFRFCRGLDPVFVWVNRNA